MKQILVAGLGNVLCSDDGVGPYLVRRLASTYRFEPAIEIADLGTPGIDLAIYLEGKDAVILVDSVQCGREPGTVLSYCKAEILQGCTSLRSGQHAPTLIETLIRMEFLGRAPEHLVLVGVTGKSYEMGCSLSEPVLQSENRAIGAIVSELARLSVRCTPIQAAAEPDIWWSKKPVWMKHINERTIAFQKCPK